MSIRENIDKTVKLIDWAESRLGQSWTLRSKEHITGEVIVAKEAMFGPTGLRIVIGERFPYFPLNLGERTIDTIKFYRLKVRVRSSRKGAFILYTHSPNGEAQNTPQLLTKENEWHYIDLDLRKIPWWKGIQEKKGKTCWGGTEGIIDALCIRLEFPQDSVVEIDGVNLLGNGTIDREPPQIDPLKDGDGCICFAITDRIGIRKSSLLVAINGLVFNVNSRALHWDGKVLSWKPRYMDDRILRVYVEAADREGNRRGLEIERFHPWLSGSKQALRIGFPKQRRSHQVEINQGQKLRYQVKVKGKHNPINRAVIIEGSVENPKILVRGGLDFETPKTLVKTLLSPNMSEREKAKRIWRVVFEVFNGSGPGSTVNRTKFFNVYGYGYCSERALTQGALYEAAGLRWMLVQYARPGGHSVTQVFYDGGWHLLDSHLRLYCVLSDGQNIASAEEIEGSPSIICASNPKVINDFKRRYWNPRLTFGPIKCFPGIESGSMAMYLREGERLIRGWQGEGRWAHSSNEPLDYANGQLVFEPQFTSTGLKKEAVKSMNISICRNGSTHSFSPRRVDERAYVTYRVHSPYLMVSGRAYIEGYCGTTRDRLAIAISTNGGKCWNLVWRAKGSGEISRQVDLLPWMSRRRVEADNPCFRDVHEFLVRIELTKSKPQTEVLLKKLRIAIDLQLHPQSLPSLHRGTNQCIFSCKKRKGKVIITHIWDEMDVVTASSSNPIEGENITLTAKITNDEPFPSGPLQVQFFDGHPDIDGKPIGEPLPIAPIPANKTVLVNTQWQALLRMHRPLHQLSPGYKGYVHTDIYAALEFSDKNLLTEGYTRLAQLRFKIRARPKIEFTSQCISWDPKQVHPGDVIRIRAIVWNHSSQDGNKFIYVHGTALEQVYVRFFAGDPDHGGYLVGKCIIPHIEPLEHGLAEVKWRVPRGIDKVQLYVEATHNIGPPSPHQKITAHKVLKLLSGKEIVPY